MNELLDANPLFSEPLGLMWIVVLVLVGLLARLTPAPLPVRATIVLRPPRLVPLGPGEAACASRLFGSIAADAIAKFEDWQ
jgi:hypothetical protein